MKQKVAVLAVGAVVFTVLFSTLIVRAQEQHPPGTLLTVAGNGKAAFSGDGGPATQAALNNPYDLAFDAAGNLFIADYFNNRIRKVSPEGIITTVAGTGQMGHTGDGGPATQARFEGATAVTLDAAGNLLIPECGSRVRKVDAAGIITTVAAGLRCPQQIAVDPMGILFIADTGSQLIRKVDSAGNVTTAAGGGSPADGRGDGGLATEARFQLPIGVALDRSGNLFVSDFVDNRVRKVSPDGKITTLAGGSQPADGVGDGGPATDARLDGPSYITLDPGGNLFIAENRGERIRKVSPAGIITTVAGTGQLGRTGDGGMATAAQLNSPFGVAVDRAGNLYFSEGYHYPARGSGADKVGNNLIRKVVGVAVPG